MDTETTKVLTDGEELFNMTQSKGWGLFQASLTDEIMKLQMIGNVEGTTNEEKLTNMEARKMASGILYDVLNKLKGDIEQHHRNVAAMQDPISTDSHIERL